MLQRSELLSQVRFDGIARVFCGVVLLFLTSQISIPLEPVPITLQTVGVLLIGLMFERRQAIQTLLTYLGLGVLGAPVFANYHGGIHCLMGATGGYLFGFLAAVTLMTTLKKILDNDNALHMFLNACLGTIVVFAFGIAWLSYFIGLKQAIQFGFFPFIVPGLVKILFLTITLRYLKLGHV